MVRNNTNWSVFKKDQDLQEAIAIICESQLKKKIDRNALAPLFPSDRTMRRQLPLIKKKIDGKLFSLEAYNITGQKTEIFGSNRRII